MNIIRYEITEITVPTRRCNGEGSAGRKVKDSVLRESITKWSFLSFSSYKKLRKFAVRILATLATTYLRKQLFSVMESKKTYQRWLSDEHLSSILNISEIFNISWNSMTTETKRKQHHDIEKLVPQKRCQLSGERYKINLDYM